MPQQLEKATIKILAGRRANTELKVLFNPAEYTHDISNNFQETALPGLANPILQFVNGESQSLSMDLFFDTWTDGGGRDVTELTQAFADTLSIDAQLHAPSPVEFIWGSFTFKAVVVSLSQQFTMFASDGKPVRATLKVTFKQYRPLSEQLEAPRRNSADKTKRRTLTADDSLWAMAAREYDHPREWRRIARANGIANPRLVPAGANLVLPPLERDDGRPALA
jgi:hypothetical protein